MDPSEQTSFHTTVPGAMKRYWFMVAAIIIACAAVGALYGHVRHHQYKATTSVVLQDPTQNQIVGSTTPSANYLSDQVSIMKLPSVVHTAATALTRRTGVPYTTDQFLSNLSVSSSTTNDEVALTFSSRDALTAQLGANDELAAYEAEVRASQKAQENATLANIDQAVANLGNGKTPIVAGSPTDQLRQQLLTLRADVVANGGASGISAVSPATLPTSPSGTSSVLLGILGAVVGLLLGALLAYLLATRRPRLANRLDPEVVLDAPLIAEISDFRSERLRTTMPSRDSPQSAAAEAFRFATAAICAKQARTDAVVLAVVSPSADDGRTTAAANIAVTRAREGARVLVIDADLEHQTLTSVLLGDIAPRPGLANLLDGSSTIDDSVISVQLGNHNVLSLLTRGTGPGSDSQSFASLHSRRVLEEIRRRFDLVIIDTPPMLTAAYGARYALEADLRLVVVRHNADPSDLEELSERISFAGADVFGYLYNRAPLRRRAPRPATGPRPGSNDRNSRTRLSDSAGATMTGGSVAAANWAPTVETGGVRPSRVSNPVEPTKGR